MKKLGIIERKGIRYLLIRPETIIEFQKAVEAELGPIATSELMARAAFSGGGKSIRSYRTKFSLSAHELAKFVCTAGTSLGWGRFKLLKLTKKELVIEVSDSPFAMTYGQSSRPVCHFIRGVVEALGESIFSRRVRAIETKCRASGARRCRFTTKLRSNFVGQC